MNELAIFDEVAATIAKWKAENEKLVFAYKTPQGEKEARSHIAKLRKGKTEVGKIHKEAKAESRAFGLRLDAKKNEYNGEIDKMISFHKEPLDAIETEKQAVIDVEKKRLEEEEAKRQADLEAREAAVKEREDKVAREAALEERKEREKRIAEEAAEHAARRATEQAEYKAAAKELSEKHIKAEEEAKEKKRIANKRHRKQVEDEIHFALTELGLDSINEVAIVLVALRENKIPHVTINY